MSRSLLAIEYRVKKLFGSVAHIEQIIVWKDEEIYEADRLKLLNDSSLLRPIEALSLVDLCEAKNSFFVDFQVELRVPLIRKDV